MEQVKQNCVAEDCHVKVVFRAPLSSSFSKVQGANPSALILTSPALLAHQSECSLPAHTSVAQGRRCSAVSGLIFLAVGPSPCFLFHPHFCPLPPSVLKHDPHLSFLSPLTRSVITSSHQSPPFLTVLLSNFLLPSHHPYLKMFTFLCDPFVFLCFFPLVCAS